MAFPRWGGARSWKTSHRPGMRPIITIGIVAVGSSAAPTRALPASQFPSMAMEGFDEARRSLSAGFNARPDHG